MSFRDTTRYLRQEFMKGYRRGLNGNQKGAYVDPKIERVVAIVGAQRPAEPLSTIAILRSPEGTPVVYAEGVTKIVGQRPTKPLGKIDILQSPDGTPVVYVEGITRIVGKRW